MAVTAAHRIRYRTSPLRDSPADTANSAYLLEPHLSMRDKSTHFFHSRQEIDAVHHCSAPVALLLLFFHLRQRLLCLGEPEGHVHGAVQVDGSSQGRTRLLPLASPGVQR